MYVALDRATTAAPVDGQEAASTGSDSPTLSRTESFMIGIDMGYQIAIAWTQSSAIGADETMPISG
jgi:hypothetical protein